MFPNSAQLSLTPKNLNLVREPVQTFVPVTRVLVVETAEVVVFVGDVVVVVTLDVVPTLEVETFAEVVTESAPGRHCE